VTLLEMARGRGLGVHDASPVAYQLAHPGQRGCHRDAGVGGLSLWAPEAAALTVANGVFAPAGAVVNSAGGGCRSHLRYRRRRGYFGAQPARAAGRYLIPRVHLQAIKRDGLRTDTPEGDRHPAVQATDDPADVGRSTS
jgi:hypothetical protein